MKTVKPRGAGKPLGARNQAWKASPVYRAKHRPQFSVAIARWRANNPKEAAEVDKRWQERQAA